MAIKFDSEPYLRILAQHGLRCIGHNLRDDLFGRTCVYLHPHPSDLSTANEGAIVGVLDDLRVLGGRAAYDSSCKAFVVELDEAAFHLQARILQMEKAVERVTRERDARPDIRRIGPVDRPNPAVWLALIKGASADESFQVKILEALFEEVYAKTRNRAEKIVQQALQRIGSDE